MGVMLVEQHSFFFVDFTLLLKGKIKYLSTSYI